MDLSAYYNEICKEPLLDRETEFDLFMELEDEGIPQAERDAIRDRIIRSNMRFCFRQAKYYSNNDPDMFAELILAANEGLVVGFNKYKPSTEVRFLSYAGHWVNQRILKSMSQMRIVSVPIWKQQLIARIAKYMEKNEGVSMENLKEEFPEASEKDLQELSSTSFLTFYIEDMSSEHPDFEIDPIGAEVDERIDNERMHKIIATLPEIQAEIIYRTFGLRGGEEMTRTDIAKDLGLTKEQLRDLRKQALDQLRVLLEDFEPED